MVAPFFPTREESPTDKPITHEVVDLLRLYARARPTEHLKSIQP
jgi:hypothetical protein